MKDKLLILDDELLILASLEHLFEDDYEVFATADAGTALQLAREHRMAVILCDERMPGAAGHEFLRRAREVSNATRVMMSGYADMSALTEAVNSGQIFAYIDKPWEPPKLRAQIAAAAVHFKLVQEVDEGRELLRALMENIPDLIYFKDCESRFTRVNQAHARYLREKDSAAVIGKSNADYFEFEDALRWRLEEEEIVRSARPQVDRIEEFKNPQGMPGWWSTTKVPMFDRGGHVSGIAGISRDITCLKNSEDMIRLLQSATVAANRSSTIEQAAQVCLDRICWYTGWPVGHVLLRPNNSPEELVSAGLWHAADDGMFAAFREASKRGRFAPGTGLPGRVLASGKPQWIADLADDEPSSERTRAAAQAGLRSGIGFPVVVEEKIVGVLEFFSRHTVEPDQEFLNIMEHIGLQLGQVIKRQRAEEDLQRAKASAESANRAKSEFLTTMSHEMRTPMNAILGMADLLAESSLGEEQQNYIRIFQKAGANLLVLINDILDLSKVESGHLELESIDFDLGGLLQKIVEMMASQAQSRGLQLILEVRPGVPSELSGDPHRLRQVLINLVGNALKFTERGSVTLRVEPDPDLPGVGLMSGGGAAAWLRFSVVDTGIGIPSGKAEMIFDRFTQADSSTTRQYGGTGLGLAISKGLAELMGGRIGCSSEAHKGSTFFLAAPFGLQKTPETAEFAEPAQIAIPELAPARPQPVSRILIAEDSEDNLVLIKAYLKNCGFELDVAVNGKIALEKAISWKPHLVLMDVEMPVMDGLEATRAIRKREAQTGTNPIPILALTAHAGKDAVERSLEAGCTEHLTKPIKKATLLAAISHHNRGKIRLTPPEGIEGLVPGYLANVRRNMDEILAGIDSADCNAARRLGHQLKGTGEGYGFPEITRAGTALELAAKAADAEEIRSQILVLSAYLDRVEIVA